MELVSIIVPVFNNEKHLKESLDGVITLNYKNIEIIVIDDGSSDSSVEIIKEFQKRDDRILFFQNDFNLGTAKTIKKGISIAQGRYIFINAADDVSLKDRVEKCLDIFKNNKKVGVIVSTAIIIDNDGLETGEMYDINAHVQNHNIALEQFKRNYCLGATMAIVNDRDLLLKEGMLEYIDDYEISLEFLLNNYDIHLLREPLVKYRVHNSNQSNNRSELANKVKSIIRKYEYEDVLQNLSSRGFIKAEIFNTLGVMSLFVDDLDNSHKFLMESEKLAKQTCNKRLEIERNFYLGVLKYKLGEYAESIDRFNKALNIDNKDPAVLNNLSVIKFFYSKGQIKDIEMLNSAITEYPEYIDAKVNLEKMLSGDTQNMKITERLLDFQKYKRKQYLV
ncbi:MAG: glycosyltransferase [Peptococcia bacterium]